MPREPRVSLDELSEFVRKAGPFGDPEGSRASLDRFVDLTSREAAADLLLAEDALRTRVIVGRKGSGKTMYLRKLQDRAIQDESVIAEHFDSQEFLPGTRHIATLDEWYPQGNDPADLNHVVAVGDWFPEEILTEMWMLVWSRAITAALTTRLLFDDRLGDYVDPHMRARIRSLGDSLPPGLTLTNAVVRSSFTYVKHFIDSIDKMQRRHPVQKGRALREALDDIGWDDLSYLVGQALEDAPPVFMYVDAIDEEFAHKPMRWLRCQKGLFYTTMRLLRSDTPLSGRLHVVISLRDIVLSSVYKSEHATRYRSSPHIRSLNWDGVSIRAFLRRKILALAPDDCFDERPTPSDFGAWLGLSRVQTRHGTAEPVEDFALRHTQVLPRDVILLGNYMALRVQDAKNQGRSRLSEEEFRDVVENVGTACGLTQIRVAANQAAAEGIDEAQVPLDFEANQRPRDEYKGSRVERLIEIIQTASSLRIGMEQLEHIRERGSVEFGCSDLPSILWQAGLIAYEENGHDVFHRSDFQSQFSLPRGKESYAFHPTMRECAGLSPSGRLVDVI